VYLQDEEEQEAEALMAQEDADTGANLALDSAIQ